jgi:MFS family permease
VGPLVGGFITTYLSWRVAFAGEIVVIGIVLSGIKLVHDVPYTGERGVDVVGAILSALGMGGIVLGILVWEEGGGAVGALLTVGVVAMGSLAWWLVRRKREGKPALLDVGLFKSKYFRFGISGQTLQQIALGGLMSRSRSSCRWCSSTTRCRPGSRSPLSRSACSSWRSTPGGSSAGAARAGSSGSASPCSPSGWPP